MKKIDVGGKRAAFFMLFLLFAATGAAVAENVQEQENVFDKFIGDWVYEGKSRHGESTRLESSISRGPGENSLVGTSTLYVDGTLSTTTQVIYFLHPRYNRWTYTSINSLGFVQEAELLEQSSGHFVFKGTAYRPDGTQTSFVWKVTVLDENSFQSESMAFHEGAWRDNPTGVYRRSNK